MTAKEKAFIEEYVVNGMNAVAAYSKIYNCEKSSCKSNAYRILKKDDAKEYIALIQKEMISRFGDIPAAIIENLSVDAFGLDENGKHSPTWQKSIDLLQKQLGLQGSKLDINSNADININIIEED